jgi:hypothetical protein
MGVNNACDRICGQQKDARTDPHSWRAVAASVRGTSHEKTGQPCQDVHHWDILPGGILVAAAADGAGSAALGEMGAGVAARTAVEMVIQREAVLPDDDDGWRSLLTEAFKAARAAIEVEVVAHEVTERDLATTLILVVATPELVAAAQVGDGASVLADSEGNVIGLTEPQIGEYINQTTFLTSPDALNSAQSVIWRGRAVHVAILSDGLQMLALKMPEGTPHAPFFSPLFRFIAGMTDETKAKEQLEAFLLSPRIRERVDDDLTLLLATRIQ